MYLYQNNFKKIKIYHLNVVISKKHFKSQSLPQFQTDVRLIWIYKLKKKLS
jgi:hypothetical protein